MEAALCSSRICARAVYSNSSSSSSSSGSIGIILGVVGGFIALGLFICLASTAARKASSTSTPTVTTTTRDRFGNPVIVGVRGANTTTLQRQRTLDGISVIDVPPPTPAAVRIPRGAVAVVRAETSDSLGAAPPPYTLATPSGATPGSRSAG
ncbi:hypothetical protein MKEN_00468900 [Mycena kentingensis (nom. inval.)]|nr:hypothetical protein MKEN_00468900 [Mycena kentingensis (nom. inval.)]